MGPIPASDNGSRCANKQSVCCKHIKSPMLKQKKHVFQWAVHWMFGTRICFGTWRTFMWLTVRGRCVEGRENTLTVRVAPKAQNKGFGFQGRNQTWTKLNFRRLQKWWCTIPPALFQVHSNTSIFFQRRGGVLFHTYVLYWCYTVWQAYYNNVGLEMQKRKSCLPTTLLKG